MNKPEKLAHPDVPVGLRIRILPGTTLWIHRKAVLKLMFVILTGMIAALWYNFLIRQLDPKDFSWESTIGYLFAVPALVVMVAYEHVIREKIRTHKIPTILCLLVYPPIFILLMRFVKFSIHEAWVDVMGIFSLNYAILIVIRFVDRRDEHKKAMLKIRAAERANIARRSGYEYAS